MYTAHPYENIFARNEKNAKNQIIKISKIDAFAARSHTVCFNSICAYFISHDYYFCFFFLLLHFSANISEFLLGPIEYIVQCIYFYLFQIIHHQIRGNLQNQSQFFRHFCFYSLVFLSNYLMYFPNSFP